MGTNIQYNFIKKHDNNTVSRPMLRLYVPMILWGAVNKIILSTVAQTDGPLDCQTVERTIWEGKLGPIKTKSTHIHEIQKMISHQWERVCVLSTSWLGWDSLSILCPHSLLVLNLSDVHWETMKRQIPRRRGNWQSSCLGGVMLHVSNERLVNLSVAISRWGHTWGCRQSTSGPTSKIKKYKTSSFPPLWSAHKICDVDRACDPNRADLRAPKDTGGYHSCCGSPLSFI